jgi:hypothetical protein
MSDPRAAIPDTVLTATDGSRFLTRCSQLLVQSERDQPIRITVDALLMPVMSVDEAGRAKCMPVPVGRQGFAFDLADIPPELAQGVAVWLAQQAEPLGRKILAQLYPEAQK